MTATIDSRVQAAEQLLTGARLLAGHGTGLIRLTGVARLLGVSIWHQGQLLAWVEREQLWHEPPTTGPLSDRPQAGTIDLGDLRKALQQALASPEGLPFPHALGGPQ